MEAAFKVWCVSGRGGERLGIERGGGIIKATTNNGGKICRRRASGKSGRKGRKKRANHACEGGSIEQGSDIRKCLIRDTMESGRGIKMKVVPKKRRNAAIMGTYNSAAAEEAEEKGKKTH